MWGNLQCNVNFFKAMILLVTDVYRCHIRSRFKCKTQFLIQNLKNVFFLSFLGPSSCNQNTGAFIFYSHETSLTFSSFTLKNVQNDIIHCAKSVRIRSYSGPYFPAFGVNTERYFVSLRIQSECGIMRTRITPYTDTFHAMS